MSVPTQEISLPSPEVNAFSTQVHRLRDVWRLVRLNRKVAFGLGILGVFVLVAIFGPIFLRQDPNSFSPDILSPPSASHLLGTTQTGQDVFLQLVVGARSSLILGFVTGLVATIISVIVGLSGGYFGGWHPVRFVERDAGFTGQNLAHGGDPDLDGSGSWNCPTDYKRTNYDRLLHTLFLVWKRFYIGSPRFNLHRCHCVYISLAVGS